MNFRLHNVCGPERVEGSTRWMRSLFRTSVADLRLATLQLNVFEFQTRVRLTGSRKYVVGQLFCPSVDITTQLPIRRFFCSQAFRNRRICLCAECILDSLAIPIAVKISSRSSLTIEECEEREFVSTLIRKTDVLWCWLKWLPAGVEILRADVQRLVYVAEVMRQQDHGDRFCDRTVVCLGFFSFQYTNAERNHFYDVKLKTSACTVGIFLVSNYRNVSVVKLTMLWTPTTIRVDDTLEFAIDPVGARRRFPALPTLDFIGKRGRSLQRHTIEEFSNFLCGRLIMCQSLVCDCTHQLMSAWSIPITIN